MKRIFQNKTVIVLLAALLIIAGVIAVLLLMPGSKRESPNGSLAKNSPAASPSVNAGDSAKSQIAAETASPQADAGNNSSEPEPATTPRQTPAPNDLYLAYFIGVPQANGGLRISSHVNGAKEGDPCTLKLTSPSGVVSSKQGAAISAGSYYSCNFGLISGVSERGAWSATLVVTSGGYTQSLSNKFTVSN